MGHDFHSLPSIARIEHGRSKQLRSLQSLPASTYSHIINVPIIGAHFEVTAAIKTIVAIV